MPNETSSSSCSSSTEENNSLNQPTNNDLVDMITTRLNNLVGLSSGYVENLPKNVKLKIKGLRGLQFKHSLLESKFNKEVLDLEKKYLKLYAPLYQKRADLINGNKDPSESDLELGYESQDLLESVETQPDPSTLGIPQFWLTCMKNHNMLDSMINEIDEKCLYNLIDIKLEYMDKGFKLLYEFSENEYFTNSTLTKTYIFNEAPKTKELMFDHAEGCNINWKENKNTGIEKINKKQINKVTQQVRIIKEEHKIPSFFDFFSPPCVPENITQNVENNEYQILKSLEEDFEIGEIFKNEIIPHAYTWFYGNSHQINNNTPSQSSTSEEDNNEDEQTSSDS